MRIKLFLLAILTIGFGACKKTTKNSPIPFIRYVGISNNTVTSGSSQDAVQIAINFTDGDGNLGKGEEGNNYDIFFLDRRFKDTALYTGLHFPKQLYDQIKNREFENGVSGSITIELRANIFLAKRDTRPDGDTTNFEIYIEDISGNKSNIITTDEIFILP